VPRPRAVLAVLAVLLLAGCSEQHPAIPPAPATTPTAASNPSGISAPTPAPTVSPAPGGGGVTLTVHQGPPPPGVRRGPAWLVASAEPASASVGIAWTDVISPDCGAVQDAWVQESADAVVIDLVHSARRAGVVCPLVLAPRHATVPLTAPLGSRVLEEHASSTGPGVPCPSPGPIAKTVQVICPLTSKG
jgi:hypothetical protein